MITNLLTKRYQNSKHFSQFYPQDGGENQLEYRHGKKLSHYRPMYGMQCLIKMHTERKSTFRRVYQRWFLWPLE